MNILICDDMKREADKLAGLIKDSGFKANIAVFQNGYDVMDYVHTGAMIDVCFLDIIMPEMSGIALAKELRTNYYAGEIVFVTTSNEFAAESYSVKAFSYLLKPPNPIHVRDVLRRLENTRTKGDTEGILLKVSKVARFILFREISHIEVIKHYVYFRMIGGEEIELYSTFGEFAPRLLSDGRFAQCHRSYIVNMSEIASIDDREIIMRCGKRIPVSKSYSDVKKKFTVWLIGGAGK